MILLIAFAIVFIAAIVRGYTGFGFAIISALGLMCLIPPVQAISIALTLDIVCSIHLIPKAIPNLEKKLLSKLLIGSVVAVPLGIYLLTSIDSNSIKMLVAIFSITGGACLLINRKLFTSLVATSNNYSLALPVGFVTGLATTMASSGGPPLMLYLLNTSLKAIQVRAVALLFFIVSSSCSLTGLFLIGDVTTKTLLWALQLLVPAFIGGIIGQRLFYYSPPQSFQYIVSPILISLSLYILITL